MDELKFCRICLNIDVKVFREDEFNLLTFYEEILGVTKLARYVTGYFCYECATLLQKQSKFKAKCEIGQKILKSLLDEGPITYASLSSLNRKEHRLETCLSRVRSSCRVALFNFAEDFTDIFENTDNNVTYETITIKEEPKFTQVNLETHFFDESDDYDFKQSPFNDSDDEPIKSLKHLEPNDVKTKSVKKVKSKITKKRKAIITSRKTRRKCEENEISAPKPKKEKIKFAKQRAAGRKFDTEKWKIVHLTEEEMHKEFYKKTETVNYQNCLHYCELCLKNFICEDTLKRHMRVHSEDKGKHECFLCKRRFNWEARLRTHIKTHQIRYHCLRCPEVLGTTQSAIAHEKIHEGVIYECQHCGAKFVKKSSYYTHMRDNHRSEHICADCGASFVSNFGLNQHKKSKHPELGNNKMTPTKQTEESTTDAIEELCDREIFCEKCKITFKSQKAFEEHKNNSAMHVEDNVNDTDVKSKPKLFKAGIEIRDSKGVFTCDQCDETFLTKASCEKHKGKRHGKTHHRKRYICEICGASLAFFSIKDHKNRHSKDTVYPCTTCDKVFKSTAERNRHIRLASIRDHKNRHTKDQLFPCNTCGKMFKSAANRSRHIRTHTGEKPFSCKLCDKRFTTRQNARMHHLKYHTAKAPLSKADMRLALKIAGAQNFKTHIV